MSNLTNYYDRFINFYCTLAEIFSDQSASFRKPVEDFIEKYKYHAESYKNSKNASIGKDSNTRSVPSVHENAVPERVKGEVINTKTPQYSGVQSFPEMDQTYWGKVLIPLFGGVGLLILGIIFHSILMIIIGIIGIIAFFFGLNANSKRCPKCRTWEPRVTVRSEKVGQRKVKVRRGLGSMYFRTSGNNTYGVRQVFVNADEYTYNEVYRCPYCGYETKGTRTAIDDGIR